MSKIIALKSGTYEILNDALLSDFSNLKQQALLFDQIGIYKLSDFYKTIEETSDLFKKNNLDISNKTEPVINELEWLRQTGIIFELTIKEEFQTQSIEQFAKLSSGQQNFEDAKNLLRKVIEIQELGRKHLGDKKRKQELIKEQHFTLLRVMSIIMEATKKVTAVTTLPYLEYRREFPNSKRNEVAQIVIKKLPLPSNETPWEQIIEYRNDPENQKNLLNLRRWVGKISTETLSLNEIEEEIEWLINEFESHMKIHKLKANTETLEVMVKTPLEIIENLVKLKFSKLPEPFFAVKKRQINLLEAEMNAPGREMAYIIKSRDTFQSDE